LGFKVLAEELEGGKAQKKKKKKKKKPTFLPYITK